MIVCVLKSDVFHTVFKVVVYGLKTLEVQPIDYRKHLTSSMEFKANASKY